MSRQTIVLVCLVLSAAGWGAGSDTRSHAAWQSIGPIDSAETWFPISSGLDDKSTGLAIDPESPDTVYAATFYRSVYKTVTGGR